MAHVHVHAQVYNNSESIYSVLHTQLCVSMYMYLKLIWAAAAFSCNCVILHMTDMYVGAHACTCTCIQLKVFNYREGVAMT